MNKFGFLLLTVGASAITFFFAIITERGPSAENYSGRFEGILTYTVHPGEMMPGMNDKKIVYEESGVTGAFEVRSHDSNIPELVEIPFSHLVDPLSRLDSSDDNHVYVAYGDATLPKVCGGITIHVLDQSEEKGCPHFMRYAVDKPSE